MNIAAKNHIYQVFSAYRDGIVCKQVPPGAGIDMDEPASSPRGRLSFDQLVKVARLDLSSPRERLTGRVSGIAAYHGFLAARESDLARAREHFATARELWRKQQEGFYRTWLAGLIEGYEAYLEYRLGDRREARRRLEHALDSSLLLEHRYGLTLFELHRMQLGHNLARIDWRFGFPDAAFALAGAMVGYLQGRRRDLPFHRDWRAKRMLSCPAYLRQRMVVQIAGEAIDHLVTRPEPAHWEIFLDEARIDDDDSGSRFFPDPRLWRWLRARRARLEGDRRRYLQTLEEILPGGPHGLGTLYYSILVDFADFCSSEPSIAARKVVGFLARDATKWKGFPAPLARRLSEIRDATPAPTRTVTPPSRAHEQVVA